MTQQTNDARQMIANDTQRISVMSEAWSEAPPSALT